MFLRCINSDSYAMHCRWRRADEIKTVLKADPSLQVTTNAPNSSDVVVTINLSSGTAAKAQALADLLAPYGNVKFSGGSVSGLRWGDSTFCSAARPFTQGLVACLGMVFMIPEAAHHLQTSWQSAKLVPF